MKKVVVIILLCTIAFITTEVYKKVNWKIIYFRRGEYYFSKKNYIKAIPYYESLLQYKSKKNVILIHLNEAYLATKNFTKADNLFEQILKLKTNTYIFYSFADMYIKLNYFDKAIQIYNKLLQKSPDNRNTRLALARAFVWSGKFEKAVEEYKKILRGGKK